MEAPTPSNFTFIKKQLTSEQGNVYCLIVSFTNNKFEFTIEKTGKIFKDKFKKDYTMSQIQENKYFKLFETPGEILEELNEKIESKAPILTEAGNNSMNLIIFLQNSKFRQVEFKLIKENNDFANNSEDFKSIIEKLYDLYDELKRENKEIKSQNEKLQKRLDEIENKSSTSHLKKNNFRWINNEVNIVDNSKFCVGSGPNVMINSKNEYSLTDGNRNHYVEFSFKTIYYLKSIRISVDCYDCSLKNFRVETISPNGEKINVGTFTRSRYKDNTGFQEFDIEKECKGAKLYLIDNWGEGGGNYILIKEIGFYVSD